MIYNHQSWFKNHCTNIEYYSYTYNSKHDKMHHILKRYKRRFVKIVIKITNLTKENLHSRIQKILKIWEYIVHIYVDT